MHDVARELCTATYEFGVATGSTADVHNALNRLVGIERRCGNWARSKELADEYVALVSGHNGELPGQQSVEQLWHMAATGDHALVAQWVPVVVAEAEASFPIGRFPILCDAGFALFAIGDLAGAVTCSGLRNQPPTICTCETYGRLTTTSTWSRRCCCSGRSTRPQPVAADLEDIAQRGRLSARLPSKQRDASVGTCGARRDTTGLELLLTECWGSGSLHRPFEHARGLLQLGGVLRRLGARTQARRGARPSRRNVRHVGCCTVGGACVRRA